MQITTAPVILEVPDLVSDMAHIRRDIHQHPEIAFEEERTSALVVKYLEELGLEIHHGLATTGAVATLHGKQTSNRRISLRADMDALYVDEENQFSHRSVNDGKMHACGHDGHTAMLLGAANYLSKNNDFAGTVYFIFQPAEKGLGEARVMIEEGLFDMFPCDAVYGLHNMPGIGTGKFGIRLGPMLEKVWGAYFCMGNGARDHFVHTPKYDLNDDAIPYGIAYWAKIVRAELSDAG